jgi:hypothetical protein
LKENMIEGRINDVLKISARRFQNIPPPPGDKIFPEKIRPEPNLEKMGQGRFWFFSDKYRYLER